MVPKDTLLDRLAVLLGSDANTLAPVALALKVHLAIASFTPGGALVPGSFTEATFTGYTAISAGVGACTTFYDPTKGTRAVQLNEPAGGWHWGVTGTTGLPQTVYGYYVTDNAGTTLYGSSLLPTPVVLTASGQGFDIGQIRFDLVPAPLN